MKKDVKKDKIKNEKYLAENLYIGCISVYDEETSKYKGNYSTILFNYDDCYYDIAAISDDGVYTTNSPDPYKFICYMEKINNYIHLLEEKTVKDNNILKEHEYLSFTDASIIMCLGAGDDVIRKGTIKTVTNTLKKTK